MKLTWFAAAAWLGLVVSASATPYMGDPVERVTAPNGAITNKKLLDRVGDFAWFKPTIENPAKGVCFFGGYGLAPMSVIEADDGLIAFDTGDTKRDGELMLKASISAATSRSA